MWLVGWGVVIMPLWPCDQAMLGNSLFISANKMTLGVTRGVSDFKENIINVFFILAKSPSIYWEKYSLLQFRCKSTLSSKGLIYVTNLCECSMGTLLSEFRIRCRFIRSTLIMVLYMCLISLLIIYPHDLVISMHFFFSSYLL